MRPPILPLAALFLLSAVPLTAGDTNMVGPVWSDFRGIGTGASLDWGDINGDGLPDVVVGAPGTDRTYGNDGVLWIYYGRPNDVPTAWPNWEWSSPLAGGEVGQQMATCDFNGDGFDDIASYYELTNTQNRLVVFLGGPTGPGTEASGGFLDRLWRGGETRGQPPADHRTDRQRRLRRAFCAGHGW